MTGAVRLDGEAGVEGLAARPKPHASEGGDAGFGASGPLAVRGDGGRPRSPPDPRHGVPAARTGCRLPRLMSEARRPHLRPCRPCPIALGCTGEAATRAQGASCGAQPPAVTETWAMRVHRARPVGLWRRACGNPPRPAPRCPCVASRSPGRHLRNRVPVGVTAREHAGIAPVVPRWRLVPRVIGRCRGGRSTRHHRRCWAPGSANPRRHGRLTDRAGGLFRWVPPGGGRKAPAAFPFLPCRRRLPRRLCADSDRRQPADDAISDRDHICG